MLEDLIHHKVPHTFLPDSQIGILYRKVWHLEKQENALIFNLNLRKAWVVGVLGGSDSLNTHISPSPYPYPYPKPNLFR
jgi:hypothetical protein